MTPKLFTLCRRPLWICVTNRNAFSLNQDLHTAVPKDFHEQVNVAKESVPRKDGIDFSKSIADFKRNGMAILPVQIDPSFVQKSKEMCFSAWEDALNRAKLIRGHELKVGQAYGFKEIVARADGRYDLHWKVNGEKHFLDEENVLSKFMPFVENILGKHRVPSANIYISYFMLFRHSLFFLYLILYNMK